jgi:putative membrane protein
MVFWWMDDASLGVFIIFWAAVITLIIWAVRRFTGRDSGSHDLKRNPLDIAKERYAKGEISKEQFEQIKRDLSG